MLAQKRFLEHFYKISPQPTCYWTVFEFLMTTFLYYKIAQHHAIGILFPTVICSVFFILIFSITNTVVYGYF